jgi:hypothetical protein
MEPYGWFSGELWNAISLYKSNKIEQLLVCNIPTLTIAAVSQDNKDYGILFGFMGL